MFRDVCILLLCCLSSPSLSAVRDEGTGTGNNGDSIQQLYEKSRDVLMHVVYPRVIPCLATRIENPVLEEESKNHAASVKNISDLEFIWNSNWPESHEQSQCFVKNVENELEFYMSWSNCRDQGQTLDVAVMNILTMSFFNGGRTLLEAQRRGKVITESIKSRKCGYVF